MFTGIVQGMGSVRRVEVLGELRRLTIELPERARGGLQIGASVAVDGVCLTVTAASASTAAFDVIDETLRVTTLGQLVEGTQVNIERSARFGDEIGGHLLSGHISGMATVVERHDPHPNCRLLLALPAQLRPYVLPKGFVAVDGVSLTVGAVDAQAGTFAVHLIPETLRVTTLARRQPGDRLNIEIDAMTQAVVDTVERVMASRAVPGT